MLFICPGKCLNYSTFPYEPVSNSEGCYGRGDWVTQTKLPKIIQIKIYIFSFLRSVPNRPNNLQVDP